MAQEQIPFPATILTGGGEARRARARRMAQALVCSAPPERRPCGVCRDCRKVAEGIHPDVIPVERFMAEKDFGGEIKVDPIRALRADAFIRPNEAARKVYVIDNAQKMNLNAQNALLKLLEEGPEYAAFLLLCDHSGALLETIRSRCALLHLEEDDLEAADPDALALARAVCAGSELERAALLARLEQAKPDQKKLEGFLEGLAEVFEDAALGGVTGRFRTGEAQALAERWDRPKLLAWAAEARRAREMLPFHVGAGHVLGWLGVRL